MKSWRRARVCGFMCSTLFDVDVCFVVVCCGFRYFSLRGDSWNFKAGGKEERFQL